MSDNTNTNNTPRTTTLATGEEYRSLSAMLADRKRERDELSRAAEIEALRERDECRRKATDYAENWMQVHISRELCAALDAIPSFEEARIMDRERPDHLCEEAWASCILIDLSSAPEIDPAATGRNAHSWRIRPAWSIDGLHWELYSPLYDFTARLGHIAASVCADEVVLDALSSFPEWLSRHRNA